MKYGTVGNPWWPVGTKVKFLGRNGTSFELKAAKKVFEVGQELTVRNSITYGWSSHAEFDEVAGSFNTVMFEVIE